MKWCNRHPSQLSVFCWNYSVEFSEVGIKCFLFWKKISLKKNSNKTVTFSDFELNSYHLYSVDSKKRSDGSQQRFFSDVLTNTRSGYIGIFLKNIENKFHQMTFVFHLKFLSKMLRRCFNVFSLLLCHSKDQSLLNSRKST